MKEHLSDEECIRNMHLAQDLHTELASVVRKYIELKIHVVAMVGAIEHVKAAAVEVYLASSRRAEN